MDQQENQQQDIDIEEQNAEEVSAAEGTDEGLTVSTDELVKQLDEARAKADEYRDQVLRTQAELENQRKRAERDLENAHKYALEKIANELLGVRDSLELGIDAARGEADAEKIREGTELTLKMLVQVMNRFDIEAVDPQGEKFDPELHQAMSMQPSDDYPQNTVISVMQKGYTLNGRLIRPAMVVVSQGKA
jgi:molecular chaperone GrpE